MSLLHELSCRRHSAMPYNLLYGIFLEKFRSHYFISFNFIFSCDHQVLGAPARPILQHPGAAGTVGVCVEILLSEAKRAGVNYMSVQKTRSC